MSPIEKAQNTDHLIKLALKSPHGEYLKKLLGQREAMLALALPSIVAKGITVFARELTQKTSLNVLIINPTIVDAVDRGQWLRHVPALLGKSIHMRASLIGPNVDTLRTSSMASRLHGSPIDVNIQKCSLDDASLGGEHFDIAVLCSPGFDKSSELLTSGVFKSLLQHKTPVILADGLYESLLLNLGFAAAHGFQCSETIVNNAVFIPFRKEGGLDGWGRFLGCLNALDDEAVQTDSDLVQALSMASSVLTMSAKLGQPYQTIRAGHPLSISVNQIQREVIALINGVTMDPANGEMFAQLNNHKWQSIGHYDGYAPCDDTALTKQLHDLIHACSALCDYVMAKAA